MPTRHICRRSKTDSQPDEILPLVRLWLLRVLVPLGGQRTFINRLGFESDKLAKDLHLDRWINNEPELASWDADADLDLDNDGSEDTDEDSDRQFKPERVRSAMYICTLLGLCTV